MRVLDRNLPMAYEKMSDTCREAIEVFEERGSVSDEDVTLINDCEQRYIELCREGATQFAELQRFYITIAAVSQEVNDQ